MDKFVFVGVEKRKSNKGNDYFMLHYGKEIESKYGVGIKPISSRINKEQFEEFSSLALGVEFLCEYQCIQDISGKYNFIITGYQI